MVPQKEEATTASSFEVKRGSMKENENAMGMPDINRISVSVIQILNTQIDLQVLIDTHQVISIPLIAFTMSSNEAELPLLTPTIEGPYQNQSTHLQGVQSSTTNA